jgi:hypothetical protein
MVSDISDENVLKVNFKRGDENCFSNRMVNEKRIRKRVLW